MKKVLIIGSSSKIGLETAKKYINNNYEVILTYYKNKIGLSNTTEYYLDVKDEDNIIKVFNEINNEFGKIDVLVNNFGICNDCDPKEKTKDDFMNVIETNLGGTFLVLKHLNIIMDKGSVINISSTNSIDTYYPESVDYDASKAGVNSLTHNFAKYYAPNIRVNALALGWVNTDMNKDMDINFKKDEEEKILLKRFANPEEIANVIYFISSDEASYINNTIIRVDGGKNE